MSHISFSELKEWAECPWKHKLNYIDKIKQFKGNEYTAFGTSLHTVCEALTHNDNTDGFDWSTYDARSHFEEEFLNNLRSLKKVNPDITLDQNIVEKMRSQGKYITQFILPALKRYFGEFKLVEVEEALYEPIGDKEEQFKGQKAKKI